MPQLPGTLSLGSMIQLVYRRLNVSATDTQFPQANVIAEIQLAETWVVQQLASFRLWWASKTTDIIVVSNGEKSIPLPEDFIWEVRLQKRVQTSPEKFEDCRVVRPSQAEGFQNEGAGDRETWTIQRGKFVIDRPVYSGGSYRIQYVPRPPTMEEPDSDVSEIPPEHHEIIPLRAAYVLARDSGAFERSKMLQEDISLWLQKLEAEIARYNEERPRENQPRAFPLGTLGYLRERIRQSLSQGSKSPDYWTNDRLAPSIDEGLMWIQKQIANLYEEVWVKDVTAVPDENNAIPFPTDMIRLIGLWRVSGGGSYESPVTIVPISARHRNVVSSTDSVDYPSSSLAQFETWSSDGRTQLKANTTATITSTYRLKYIYRISSPVGDEDMLDVPIEHMDILQDYTIYVAANSYGESTIAAMFKNKYESTLVEVTKLTAQIRLLSKQRGIVDRMGYDQENYGYAGAGYYF